MEIRWSEVPDSIFEVIVAHLLRALDYRNVVLRTGGSDEGWDIDAETHVSLPDARIRVERWRIECKRYTKRPSPVLIRDHFVRMASEPPKPHNILFVTSAAFSNPVKQDLNILAAQASLNVAWWEKHELGRLISNNLADTALRQAIAPFVQPGFSITELQEASAQQITGEIARRVGTKYIPMLYRKRPIESIVGEYISTSLNRIHLNSIASEITQFRASNGRRYAHLPWDALLAELERADSWAGAEPQVSRLLTPPEVQDKKRERQGKQGKQAQRQSDAAFTQLNYIVRMAAAVRPNCFLLREKAGSGKTNLLCQVATNLDAEQIIGVLLVCRFIIAEDRSLEQIILDSLRTSLAQTLSVSRSLELEADLGTFFQSLISVLETSNRHLLVFLDGINENRDLPAVDAAITNLLEKWNGYPVKFVVTCRDIFWDFFDERTWRPFLYRRKLFSIPSFEESELDPIIRSYLTTFQVTGQLVGSARLRCSHPLLLRFFCEAYQGRDIGVVGELRMIDLFDYYWRRKREEIAVSLGFGRSHGQIVDRFLLSISEFMLKQRSAKLLVGALPEVTGDSDLDSTSSLYRRMLDEDIILEELPGDLALDMSYLSRRVSFVYDEFFDYVTALAYVRLHQWDSKDFPSVCLSFLDALAAVESFEQLRGISEYLVIIAERKGYHEALCSILACLGDWELLCKALPKLHCEYPLSVSLLRGCFLASTEFLTLETIKTRHKNVLAFFTTAESASSRGTPNLSVAEALLVRFQLGEIAESIKPLHVLTELFNDADEGAWVLQSLDELIGTVESVTLPDRLNLFDSPNTLVDLASTRYVEIFRALRSEVPPLHQDASREIVKTIWALWRGEPESVWQILENWPLSNIRLLQISQDILIHGFSEGYIEPPLAGQILIAWLKKNRESALTALLLLPTLPSAEIFRLLEDFPKLDWVGRRVVVVSALVHLLELPQHDMILVLADWERFEHSYTQSIVKQFLRFATRPLRIPPRWPQRRPYRRERPRQKSVAASAAAIQYSVAQAAAPPPLHEEGVALDAARGRLVLFGGTRAEGESYVNVGDTWEWDGSGWRLAVLAADGPGARTAVTMAYNPKRRAVVMYGGVAGDWDTSEIQLLRDVWTYDGVRWVRGPDGPESWNGRLVYDSRRGEMLLAAIAGPWVESDGPFRVSLWRRHGAAWVFADSSGPRISSTLRPAFDTRRGVLVLPVLEGPDAGVWEWDGRQWRHMQTPDGPRPRSRFIVAYDEDAGGVILFGGVAGPPPESFNDLWMWDGEGWIAMAAAPSPAPRSDGTLVYDPVSARLLLVGGIGNDDTMFRELWKLDASGWRKAAR